MKKYNQLKELKMQMDQQMREEEQRIKEKQQQIKFYKEQKDAREQIKRGKGYTESVVSPTNAYAESSV